MPIHFLSDLRLETGPIHPPSVEADVTVLAGDIWTKGRGVRWAADAFPDRPVLYVLGNHEYYGNALPRMLEKGKGTNVYVMERDVVEVGGVRFLGTTLWTDFDLLGDPNRAIAAAAQGMNDYKAIRVSPTYKRLKPTDNYLAHRESLVWLGNRLRESTAPTVVITHHAPSAECLSPAESPGLLDAAYASRLDDLITETDPCAWIHGHHHRCVDFDIGLTRLLSNCRGCAHEEAKDFDPRWVVEVG